jgi:hypothetical protein
MDAKAKSGNVLLQTVEDNTINYTARDYSQATLAHRIHQTIGIRYVDNNCVPLQAGTSKLLSKSLDLMLEL